MIRANDRTLSRRHSLKKAAGAQPPVSPWAACGFGARGLARLLAGEGVVDTTPPLGIEMGGSTARRTIAA